MDVQKGRGSGLLAAVASHWSTTTHLHPQTFMAVVSILHVLANIAAVYVLRWQHSAANADAAPQAGGPGRKLQRAGSLRRMNTTLRLAVRHDHSWVSGFFLFLPPPVVRYTAACRQCTLLCLLGLLCPA